MGKEEVGVRKGGVHYGGMYCGRRGSWGMAGVGAGCGGVGKGVGSGSNMLLLMLLVAWRLVQEVAEGRRLRVEQRGCCPRGHVSVMTSVCVWSLGDCLEPSARHAGILKSPHAPPNAMHHEHGLCALHASGPLAYRLAK